MAVHKALRGLTMKMNFKPFLFLTLSALVFPLTVSAHQVGGNGLASGATHPLSGFDHLLAMVAVGILGAQLGSRAIWKVPVTFAAFMVVGGALALAGIGLPGVEPAIALSVLVLGSAIAVSKKLPLGWALACVALFAVFHGHAHGEEMPLIANAAVYATGFVLSTAALHVTGVLIGHYAPKNRTAFTALRYAGAVMGLAGIVFLAGLV